jgi:hypothetical protein
VWKDKKKEASSLRLVGEANNDGNGNSTSEDIQIIQRPNLLEGCITRFNRFIQTLLGVRKR